MKKVILLVLILMVSCNKSEDLDSTSLEGEYIGTEFFIGCDLNNYYSDEMDNFYQRTKMTISSSNSGVINALVSNSRCYLQARAENGSVSFTEKVNETTYLVDFTGNNFESESNIFKNGRYKVLIQGGNKIKFIIDEGRDYFILFASTE